MDHKGGGYEAVDNWITKLPTSIQDAWDKACVDGHCDEESVSCFLEFLDVSLQRCERKANRRATEAKEEKKFASQLNSKQKPQSQPSASALTANTSKPTCPICQKDHTVEVCFKFINMSAKERAEATAKMCSLCLREGHTQRQCKAPGPKGCTVAECSNRAQHHTMLHRST